MDQPTDLLFHSFHAALGDWVAIVPRVDAPDGVDPWFVEAIFGWAIYADDDQATQLRILPCIGGDDAHATDDHIGIYRRIDLTRLEIRTGLHDLIRIMRANRDRVADAATV